jgi:endoglucanase
MFFNRFNKIFILFIITCTMLSAGVIHVNQIGYYPNGTKIAIAVGAKGDSFSIVSASSREVVFTKKLTVSDTWDASGETTVIADFTEFTTPGDYKIRIARCKDSYVFTIGSNVNLELVKATIKGFYFNRASMAIEKQYGGKWARPAGHPDNSVTVHASAASSKRPTGSKISSPGGWYDAGDYGKYIVNSGISTYTLFAAYQAFPSFFDTLKLTIPESSNTMPDLLDEALYNLKWMLTMQDPEDGGVYHKLTTANFSGFVRPDKDGATRYVTKKTTAATYDFIAVTAQAARLFRKFDNLMPGFAQQCLDASLKAWRWASLNKSVVYNQASLNSTSDPDISTGEYGDSDLSDELKWAAQELYLTTRADSFFTIAYPSGKLDAGYNLPDWRSVGTLGLYSMFLCKDSLTSAVAFSSVTTALNKLADIYVASYEINPYRTTMNKSDFVWGSNAVGANQGMLLMLGSMAGNKSCKAAATGILDYLLGKNPTNYSFVTGYGDKLPIHPHHRPSGSDNATDPVPGFLVGGPNAGREDSQQCTYASTAAALSYNDNQDCYACNEVAINWNAPMVFLTAAAEVLQ